MFKRKDPSEPLSPSSFDYYPGTPDNRRSMHSTSFAYRGPRRPLPREPRFDFDNEPSDEEDGMSTGSEEEFPPGIQQQPYTLQASGPSQNLLRSNRGRPLEAPSQTHWKKLSCSEKSCKLLQKFPWVHFVGFVLCFTFGIIFAVESHFSFDTLLVTLQEVMHMSYYGMETVEILATAFGCFIAALSALILLSAMVTAYHGITSDGSSIPNATPSLLLILVLYPAAPIWCCLLGVSLVAALGSMVLEGVCSSDEISSIWHQPGISTAGSVCDSVIDVFSLRHCINCIDLYPYHFLFPNAARREDMEICGREIWLLCSADLPQIVWSTQLSTISAGLVLLGIALHLLALAYNRATLGERQKLKDYKDLIYIRTRVQSVLVRNSADANALLNDPRSYNL